MKEAVAIMGELEAKYFIAFGLAAMAGPVGAKGQPEWAARLLGASEALLEAMGVDFQPADRFAVDRYRVAVRRQLDDATFEAAWAEGRAMSLEQVVAYALGEDAK